MNTQTFIKRIAFACTKSGQLNKRYETACTHIANMSAGKVIYPYRWTRSKGHCNLKGANDMQYTELLCKNLGIELHWGNDAPRGGMDGNYIYLNKKDIQKLKTVDLSVILK